MLRTIVGSQRPGLLPSERAALVHDFLDLLPLGEPLALAPFLAADVRFEGADDAVAVGRGAVLSVWARVVRDFATFGIDVVAVAGAADRVLVEQRLTLAVHPWCEPTTLRGEAEFVLRDAQIVLWRQRYG